MCHFEIESGSLIVHASLIDAGVIVKRDPSTWPKRPINVLINLVGIYLIVHASLIDAGV